jgi:pimeloyl-ACP methyl ester carboxylesterase
MSLPLLFIPGLNCTTELFADQISHFSPHRPVVVADHTGHDSVGAIVRSILQSAPDRFALCGLSMGGYLALEVMRQAPHRVDRLALLDTGARGESPQQAETRRKMIAFARAGQFKTAVEATLPLLLAESRNSDAVLLQRIRAMAADTGVDNYLKQLLATTSRPVSIPLLATITVPALVLVGSEDQITPPALAKEMAGLIANSTLVQLDDCGHMSTMEKPDEVIAALEEWLG